MALLVVETDPGTLEVRYTWLPTFIGLDIQLMADLSTSILDPLKGQEITDALLEKAHEDVVDAICKRYPIENLRTLLQATKAVTL